MRLSASIKTRRLREARRELHSLRTANARLRSYIEALESMAVRSVSLTPAQFKSAVRRRQSLNLNKPS